VTNYQNKSSQAEREAELRNDQRVRSGHTFQSRAIAEADDVRGRWAEINKSNVVGATPRVEYPRLPENSWTNDPTGVEPSLGIDVNAVEPCGEKFEIEALDDVTTVFDGQSVASPLAGVTATASVDDPSRTGGAEAPTAVTASPRGEPPASKPNPKPKRGV
jgi:hypothetical protein